MFQFLTMKHRLLFVSFLFVVLLNIAQTNHTIPDLKKPTSFSSTRLQKAERVIQSWVDQNWMNGGVGLIMRNGKVEFLKSFGYANVEKKIPMKTDHIFRIASQTKAITSLAVMMLYEDGKFLLDEPVSKFIPEFKNPVVLDKFNEKDTTFTTVPAKREISIRDLLTHTSGIGYAQIGSPTANAIYAKYGVVGGIGVKGIKLADNIKKLGPLPLFHQPGEKYLYGLNTDVLGYLVEVVSGMSLDEFFRIKIFQPLGMKDTYFYLPKEKQSRLVTIYTQKNGVQSEMEELYKINGTFYRDYPNMNFDMFSGGGGLSSTITDYAIFLQMMLNGGEYNGVRLLSRNAVRMMTQNQIGNISNGTDKFGLGFGIVTEAGSGKLPTNTGTYSWGGMFSTSYWVDPKEKIVGLFFTNIYPAEHGDMHDRFKVLMYQAINE